MPKAFKSSSSSYQRTAPYPTQSVATAAPIAPSPAMAHQTSPPSPHQPGPDRHASGWTNESDEKLKAARLKGLNWQPIATQFFPDKTANACRKRHERLMEKINAASDWNGVKMDELAKAYLSIREKMWRILAEETGEKWQTVEAKCMEKGLKTLTAAGRTASRRERGHYGNGNVEYHGVMESSYLQQQPQPEQRNRDRSKSHQGDGDDFNDSGIAADADHSFLTNNQNEHQRSYASSIHNDQGPYSGGATTPPHSITGRSYSTSSSTGVTPSLPVAPGYPPVQQPSPFQTSQTLPSFSSAFGMPSMNAAINRHSPHHYNAVTTQ